MKTSRRFYFLLAILFMANVGRTQETFSYSFTNVTHNQTFTVYATSSDFINLTNVGQDASYHVLFGEDYYFSPEDNLSSHNTFMYFSNQQQHVIALSNIASSHFYIRVTRENGIQLLTLEVIMGSLDLDDLKIEAPIVFPNPVSDFLVLQNSHGFYTIFDLTGKVHLSGQADQTEVYIDIRELPQGMYIIAIDENWYFKFWKK